MYGRYGVDHLNNALMILALVLSIISLFFGDIAVIIISVLQLMLLMVWFLRAFSRNIYKRRRENEGFLKLWTRIKTRFKGVTAFFKRLGDRKHKYFKCPNCRSRLRVPRHRGKITVTCPRCYVKFDKKS